jgi:hypothetical protein
MAGSFGDADSVRRLGQALLAAGRGVGGATSDLTGQVRSLVPSGWSGKPAEAFGSDWGGKAGQAAQLAAVCTHVGQVLVDLAGELESVAQRAANAQQMGGGPVAARFGDPGSEQRSAQMLSQATGAADQARAAARAKLAGIQVPRIGTPLTARQVDTWTQRMIPQPSVPGLDHWLHEAGTFALEQIRGVGDTGLGLWDGYKQLSYGLWDLIDVGSPSFDRTWEGLGRLFEVWNLPTMESAWGGLEKSLVSWDEWRTDPARAMGHSIFNIGSLIYGPKVLKAGTVTPDAGQVAGEAGSAAADTADTAGDAAPGRTAMPEEPSQPPGPPPGVFGRQSASEVGGDRLDLPPDKAEQLEYREPLTPDGEPVPLFDGTPVPEQATQQKLDDCGLVAALRGVARYHPEALKEAIRETPDSRVILRLHKVKLSGYEAVPTGDIIEVPISREVPIWKDSGAEWGIPASKASWGAMTEKALAAVDKRWTAGRIEVNDDLWRQQATIRGLRNEDATKALIDARGYARLNHSLTHQEIAEVMAELTGERASVFSLRSKYVESSLSHLIGERKPIIASSKAESERAGLSRYRVVPGHAYEVTGVEDGKIIMKNPWGYSDPAPVPAGKFLNEFQNLIVTFG